MVHVEGIDDRMIANNLEPHYLTHPGEVIKDEFGGSWYQPASVGQEHRRASKSAERVVECQTLVEC